MLVPLQLKTIWISRNVLATKQILREVIQMVSTNTLCKKILNVKDMIVEDVDIFEDAKGVTNLRIMARPYKRVMNTCPKCGRTNCPGYDERKSNGEPVLRSWRSLDFAGIPVHIVAHTRRIECPEHGVIVGAVPWAHHDCDFTKDFDNTVAWMAKHLTRQAASEYMRIDWKTVGRCVSRVRDVIEPDISVRLDGLEEIGIDETSYRKGHKYITVVVNHANNTVVWAHEGFGKDVLRTFLESMTAEQRASIKIVTADGARWISDCVEKFLPNAALCVDSFHVVQWINDALDELRKSAWREAYAEVQELTKDHTPKCGRPAADDTEAKAIAEAKQYASEIKNSMYALGKNPENLTEKQRLRLEWLSMSNNKLSRAYHRKEQIRGILHMSDPEAAEEELTRWLWWASHSRIPEFIELGKKIRRHKDRILNTIRMKMSNARIEATNNKIKILIKRAYGFRNIQNLIDLILLVCSKLEISLPNRPAKRPQLQEA